jgi:Protein of unknown function (DUF3313)
MSKIASHRGPAVLAITVIAALCACAETKQEAMTTAPAPTFLPEPALLKRGQSGGEADLVYFSPNTNWASYTRMNLEPITIWTGTGTNMQRIPPQQRQALASTLHEDLYDAISKRCTMATDQTDHRAGTAIVRVAIIDATNPNKVLDTISTYIPQVHTLDVLAGYALDDGVAYWVGNATIEGYARDATSGALLWEAADERAGTKSFARDVFKSWDDVDNAFKAWADQFSNRIVALGACPRRSAS